MHMRLNETWDLERFFTGGSASPALIQQMDQLEAETTDLKSRIEQLGDPVTPEGVQDWATLLKSIEEFVERAVQAGAFLACLTAQDVNDTRAKRLQGRLGQTFAQFESAVTLLDQRTLEMSAESWNHLAGYRLNLYRHRGWHSVLKEPLDENRMTEPTLDAMWAAVEGGKDRLGTYLERKAQLLGLEAPSWFDLDAPVATATRTIPYDEAASFIVEHFRRFSPEMADFATMAFEDRWIEAENRAGKRPGGFCTGFPLHSESRIFMTFDGSLQNVATAAHELGHAYHNYVMRDLRPLAREFPMNVAETASTFAETLVSDAALKAAETSEEQIALLDDRIGRSVALLMNIHARFLFETEFYEARKKGPIGVEQLGEMMVQAQKRAYRDALADYHPYFWASKLHFYKTEAPFYNFPYTFGYLFSTGVYARALDEGPGFASKYVNLLRDTGRMTAEDLAQTHLDVDLTRPQFWQNAVSLAVSDVDAFLKMTGGRD